MSEELEEETVEGVGTIEDGVELGEDELDFSSDETANDLSFSFSGAALMED